MLVTERGLSSVASGKGRHSSAPDKVECSLGCDAMEVPMRTFKAIMAAALLSVTSASAQTQPQSSAFGANPIIRIATQFRARIEGVSDPRDVPDAKAQEAARRALYDMAANECAALSEIWKAECRLGSFSITIPNVTLPTASVTATAFYELRVRTSGR
jgi:hypothetical protein